MIILFAILAIAAIAGFAIPTAIRNGLPKENYTRDTRRNLTLARYVIVGACAAIAVLVTLAMGIRVIDQTEVGVVKTFGKVDRQIYGGLNFLNPISDTLEIMDCRVHVREVSFDSYTKDAQPVKVSIEYQYEPYADKAMDIVTQYGSYEILETKISASVEERAKIVVARYSAMPLLETRSTLSAQVDEEIKLLEDVFPVHFTNAIVKDIYFSDAFEAAVEAKMQAEQNALRAENEKKEAVTRAEQAKEVAAINAEAAIATAAGEAKALEITRQALENMPDTWVAQQYLEKWDGKLPQLISGDGSGVMLVPDLGE